MSNKPREPYSAHSCYARNAIRNRDDLTASIVKVRGVQQDERRVVFGASVQETSGDQSAREHTNATTTYTKPIVGSIYIRDIDATAILTVQAMGDATHKTYVKYNINGDSDPAETALSAAWQTLTIELDVSALSGLYEFAIYLKTSNVAFTAKIKNALIELTT